MVEPIDAIISYDLAGRMTGWDAGAAGIFGYSTVEMVGSSVARLIPPDERCRIEDLRMDLVHGRTPGPLETVRLDRDGRPVPVRIALRPVHGWNGTIVAFCELIRSTGARPDSGGWTAPVGQVPAWPGHPHYLETELYQLVRDDPAIFDFLQDGSLDGLWYWDLDHPEHEWMSPRLKEVFGYADQEIPNTPAWWQEQIFPEDLRVALDNYSRHRTDPRHRYDQIVRYRHRDGSTVWVRCRGIVIRDVTGHPIRMLGAHTDITPIKRAERELADRASALERALAQVADANRLKADVAGTLNHEVNQPLCVISNYSSLLLRKWDALPDQRRLDWLRSISNASQEMSRLIADLMLMFRLDASVVPVSRAAVEVGAAVEQAVQRMPDPVGADLEVSGAASVLCDPGYLRQALVNLLINAHKHGRPPIRVDIRADGGAARIVVRDHGPGVAAEFVPHLFDRFSRADGAAGVGAGLGLYVVDQVMRANGGSVRYQSAEPGACFVLELDLAGEVRAPVPVAAAG
jgi:PAS domain S-box-containing protein